MCAGSCHVDSSSCHLEISFRPAAPDSQSPKTYHRTLPTVLHVGVHRALTHCLFWWQLYREACKTNTRMHALGASLLLGSLRVKTQ